jgi:hypothetical protein
MTGRATALSAEQTQDMIEALVRARRQVTVPDLATAMKLTIETTRRHLRALLRDERLHKVKPLGWAAPAGGIWAAGPAVMLHDGEPIEHEPVHLTVLNWAPGMARASQVETHFFGRAEASEVRP